MDEALEQETQRLTRSWMQHDQAMLRDYLVAGVEDPRINVQSILTRHFLSVALFGEQFARLMEQEIRFALVLNWVRSVLEKSGDSNDIALIRHALQTGADNAEGIAIPRFVAATWASLPALADGSLIPNYVESLLQNKSCLDVRPEVGPEILNTFQRAWNERLFAETSTDLSVFEPACGSANDYRFLHAFGLTRLINYSGFDLCEKNVRNAQLLFPSARFALGNVFAIAQPDQAMDYCIVHDLFEHLSAAGIEQALSEVCRVTRREMCLGFFNVYEGNEHLIRPTDDYHWNTLSLSCLRATLERQGFSVQTIHLATWLKWRFGCGETHNQNAYTLFASRNR